MKFNTIIKLVCAVSLLAAGLTAAPMESVKDEEVAPSTPAVTLPDASAMPVVEVAEEEDDEDDNSSLLVETGVDAPVSIVTETADKPLPVTPAAGQTTTQLVLASKEDVANARSNAVVAFKHTWDPLTRIITVNNFRVGWVSNNVLIKHHTSLFVSISTFRLILLD